ncbi:MAG: tRNA 2-thiouridine(34) synthase MnmA [Gammaproteobacteria bacterium]|nr:tRNA 2-thiouridine(34) synthase MnmA [Gammaproteobacteria bacterium]
MSKSKRVILGMSGGVDSSVAALLLKQQGYDVHGLFMTNWEEDEEAYCTAAEDLQDARKVAEQIGIPLHHVNFAKEYRERVFSYFLDEYKAGRTPNPDVLCNREIKFGAFFDYAKRLGGELIATGHYARLIDHNGRLCLAKAVDQNKDQSYFLHAVDPDAFQTTLFPLGELGKPEIRDIATQSGLHVHQKKDSTGICFIGERPFKQFLETFLPAQPGKIQALDGKELGEHSGLMYYTIGQRQGLGIGGVKDAPDEPWYVVQKDLEKNILVVAQGDHPLLYSQELSADNLHWLIEPVTDEFTCTAKTRYRQSDQACRVQIINDRVNVNFEQKQRAVTPGQFVVFYQDELCLGGGVIASTQ